MDTLCMEYRLPRSTFHHTSLFELFRPISSVLIQVVTSLSTAFRAMYAGPTAVCDCVAYLFLDISTAQKKLNILSKCRLAYMYVENWIEIIKDVLLPRKNQSIWNLLMFHLQQHKRYLLLRYKSAFNILYYSQKFTIRVRRHFQYPTL